MCFTNNKLHISTEIHAKFTVLKLLMTHLKIFSNRNIIISFPLSLSYCPSRLHFLKPLPCLPFSIDSLFFSAYWCYTHTHACMHICMFIAIYVCIQVYAQIYLIQPAESASVGCVYMVSSLNTLYWTSYWKLSKFPRAIEVRDLTK